MKYTALLAIVSAADWAGNDKDDKAPNNKIWETSKGGWSKASVTVLTGDNFKDDQKYATCTAACDTYFNNADKVKDKDSQAGYSCQGVSAGTKTGGITAIACSIAVLKKDDQDGDWVAPEKDNAGTAGTAYYNVDTKQNGDGDSAIQVGATLFTAAVAALYM